MNNDMSTPQSFIRRNFSWRTIVLGLLAVGTFLAISSPGMMPYPILTGGRGVMETSGGPGVVPLNYASDSSAPSMMPYYGGQDVPVTDTREFAKVYYNASMRSRDVQGLTRRVETTVRGYDGRVDQESSSQQYGSVSFAIPKTKYDAFRAELESLVGRRFISINISSENMLPQKVSIEEQQKQADASLADAKAQRQRLITAHANKVAYLQAQIQSMPDQAASFTQQLAAENATYAAQLNSADANIKYAQDWQKAVQTQDQTLLDNVATVTGTVSIQWISMWETVQLYLPGYWIPFIFAVLTVISYLWDRRRMHVSRA